MPVLDGVEATRRIHADFPDLPIVILTMHGEEALRREAVDAGATGFLTKDVSMQDVVSDRHPGRRRRRGPLHRAGRRRSSPSCEDRTRQAPVAAHAP